MGRLLAACLFCSICASAAPKRVLYITHSAGFRHGSIETSREILREIGERTGAFEVVASEDLALLSADTLRDFDVLFFFTSGELALSDAQKADLLAFVRNGKGFGGAHSATDTLYQWAGYGELIGAYFNGHPWVQEVSITVENPGHPIAQGLGGSFRILDEIYQFRNFLHEGTEVLMSLDTASVDLNATGVEGGEFPLAWTREYGAGRVFYTALGHFDETWLDPRMQSVLRNAILWLAGEEQAPPPALPRSAGEARQGYR
jgi:type 1 glutamine amidotransferase